MEIQEFDFKNNFIHNEFQKPAKTHIKMNDGVMKINRKF